MSPQGRLQLLRFFSRASANEWWLSKPRRVLSDQAIGVAWGTDENPCWLIQLGIAAGGRVLFSVIGEDVILLWLWRGSC
jgi:hypothetical protein